MIDLIGPRGRTSGYVDARHRNLQDWTDALEEMGRVDLTKKGYGVGGCPRNKRQSSKGTLLDMAGFWKEQGGSGGCGVLGEKGVLS